VLDELVHGGVEQLLAGLGSTLLHSSHSLQVKISGADCFVSLCGMSTQRTFVIGVGMTKFDKPGTKEGNNTDWAQEAGRLALEDAGVPYSAIEQAYAGYVYGNSTTGQRAVYGLGLTGIPVVNVNNNCSTGSSALFLARQAVKFGVVDCALAVGFEQMQRGSLKPAFPDHVDPMDHHLSRMHDFRAAEESPRAPQFFGNAARDHMERYGSTPDHFAWIGYKNHKHSVNNPYSQFQDVYTLDEIKNARMIHEPLTKLQCSPTSDGAACAIVASERFVDEHDLWDRAIEITGQSMVTDLSSTFDENTDCIKIVGYDMSAKAAQDAYAEAGINADQVDVCELHDCFSANELISYEALGFAAQGEGHKLVDAEATTFGGSGPVVNTSGGLISKGHPLGATGLAQCSELTWQLRGTADKRQVAGAKVALQHNIGLGGAAVVTVYQPPVA
jgi:acetyl-CoA acetyltransferase